MPDEPDGDLLERFVRGDQEAFEALFRQLPRDPIAEEGARPKGRSTMIDDERLARLLEASLPPAPASGPSRDLWPVIVSRRRTAAGWSWLDISLATVVAAALLMFPRLLLLLAYHL